MSTSIKLKHIPLYPKIINKYLFIIENVNNGLNLLKKLSNLYEIECEKLRHDPNWFYDKKSEFVLDKEIKKRKEYKISNVYNALKKLGAKFISYDKIQKFIGSFIPKNIYQHEFEYMYHGSRVNIKGYVEPRNDGFEKVNYVYANCIRTPSLKFSTRKGIAVTLQWGVIRNWTWFLEIYPKTFEDFKSDGYMYTLNKNNFVPEHYPVYISSKKQRIIKREHIKNIYQEMKNSKDCIMIN